MSGSKPGWKFETTVGVANSAAKTPSAPRASRAAARRRPARARNRRLLTREPGNVRLPGLSGAAVRAGHRRGHGRLPLEAARARVGADVLGSRRLAAALVARGAHR